MKLHRLDLLHLDQFGEVPFQADVFQRGKPNLSEVFLRASIFE